MIRNIFKYSFVTFAIYGWLIKRNIDTFRRSKNERESNSNNQEADKRKR